jgi:Tol biopolymer transport system component
VSLAPGARLGPYEITAPIGAGGMGEVYRARDTRLDRTVAIKVLPSAVAADPEARTRFEREARAIAALDHPHICPLHDIGHAEGIDFLVMRLLEGETLAERMTKGRLPLDQVVRFGAEVADALDKAHRAGITHRDLKPANVMLTKAGAVLLDFGLAKRQGPAPPVGLTTMTGTGPTSAGTAKGTLLGTLHYMAPEQVEGREADARSDIFALGAVLYEMATATRPFDGDSPASVIGAILKDDPPAVSARQPLSPLALDHVVARCLAKDPDQRWQSAADVKHGLQWALTSGLAGKTDSSGAWRIGALGWAALTVMGVALAVTSPYAVRQWLSTTPVPAAVTFDVFPPSGASFPAQGAAVPSTQLSLSPDGRRLAFVATAPEGRPMVWVRTLDRLEAQALPGTEGAVFPFWSPDSRFVGFFAQGKMKRTDLVGGPPQVICDASPESTRGATWNRDGTIVFVSGVASGLQQVSAGGGVPAPAIPLREGDVSYRWPTFLPDGRHLIFHVRSTKERPALYVGSIDGATMTRVLETASNGVYASGYLLTTRDRSLLAYPFDEQERRITGDLIPVAENVGRSSTDLAAFSLSAAGVLAHTAGFTTSSRLTWVDRGGRSIGQLTEAGDYNSFQLSPDEQRLAFTQVDAVTNTQDIWLVETARGVPTRFTFDPLHDLSPIWSPRQANHVQIESGRWKFPVRESIHRRG